MKEELEKTLVLFSKNGLYYLKGSGQKINMPKYDKELFKLLGFISGDGYIVDRSKAMKNSSWMIGLVEDDLLIIKEFQRLVKKFFNITPRYYQRNGTYFETYFYSRIVYEILTTVFNLPDGKKIGKLRIPIQALKSRGYYLSLLVGLYSTDGKFTVYKGYPRIGVESATKEYLEDIKKILLKEGFNPRLYIWKRKKGNYLYGIYLNGKEQVKMFYKKIGFSGEKNKRLKRYINHIS